MASIRMLIAVAFWLMAAVSAQFGAMEMPVGLSPRYYLGGSQLLNRQSGDCPADQHPCNYSLHPAVPGLSPDDRRLGRRRLCLLRKHRLLHRWLRFRRILLPNWFELRQRLRFPTLPLRGHRNRQWNGHSNSVLLCTQLYEYKCVQMCRYLRGRMLQLRFFVQCEQRLRFYSTDFIDQRDCIRDPERMHNKPDCVPDYAWRGML